MIGLINRGNLPTSTQSEFENIVARIREFFLKEHNEDGTHLAGVVSYQVPIGGVVAWTTATAPSGWIICDGGAVNRVTYKSLFDVIGITYGAGDGATTFNVPNLTQRFILGKAASGTGSTLAGTGGSIDHTHTISSDGSHDHGGNTGSENIDNDLEYTVTNVDDNNDGLTQSVVSGTGTAISLDPASHSHTISSGGSHTHGGATGTGNPPFLSLNYIIFSGV